METRGAVSGSGCRSGDSHCAACACHEARWAERLAAAEERADALMKALLWCDLVLGQAMTAEDDAEQPVPGEETASSIKWRLRRVLHRLRLLTGERDSEARWAKEYLDRAVASEERGRRMEEALRVFVKAVDSAPPRPVHLRDRARRSGCPRRSRPAARSREEGRGVMTTIHKYKVPVPRFNECLIEMPRHAKAIHVAEQAGEMMLWAEVDTEEPMVQRRFCVFGTGHRLTPAAMNGRYVGTAHLNEMGLVFHVYEARS